jgi:hypothetical protein
MDMQPPSFWYPGLDQIQHFPTHDFAISLAISRTISKLTSDWKKNHPMQETWAPQFVGLLGGHGANTAKPQQPTTGRPGTLPFFNSAITNVEPGR